jgi:hypothetical protein
MQRAATQPPTQHSSKHTTHQPPSASSRITPTQVWECLSAMQQQVLQRTLTSVCRSLVNRTATKAKSEEVHDDRS